MSDQETGLELTTLEIAFLLRKVGNLRINDMGPNEIEIAKSVHNKLKEAWENIDE